MIKSQAMIQINKLPRISSYKKMDVATWEKHQCIIAIIERDTQDMRYIQDRNALIPIASGIASSRASTGTHHDSEWSNIFLGEMNRLAKERRL